VINHYGPTEATIGCLTGEIDLQQLPHIAPLGLPLPGTALRIMNGAHPVPRGAWGELVVSGPAISDGYLHCTELTARAFGSTASGVRCYRTGDRVRLGPAGKVIFGGRFDDQVKVRGFRIELQEIDAQLRTLPEVTACLTLVHADSAALQSLVSCVTPAHLDGARLQERLRHVLPDYMVPARIVTLEALPLLGNGKVDRQALRRRLAACDLSPAAQPVSAAERSLQAIFAGILERPLPMNQRFFDAGGSSLVATRLVNELTRQFGVRIPVKLLMQNPTGRELAAIVSGLIPNEAAPAATDAVEIDI
jgi:acyl-coenzyme A synthetase/AMP-(fatty) acid ligase/acyl carrier protein